MKNRVSSMIALTLALSLSVSILNCTALDSVDKRTTEYQVTVLPCSDQYRNFRTDGRYFYSESYPDTYAVYAGTGASIYNLKGELILPQEKGYYFVNDDSVFSDGLLCVKQYIDHEEKNGYTYLSNPKYGYIDENGAVAINFDYEMSQDFSCGLGVVKKDGKYGCIDRNGNVIIDFLFENIYPFKDGYAQALLNGAFVTLDVTGVVTKGKFDDYRYMSPFVNGFAFARRAPVFYNQYYGNAYVDLHGYLQYDEYPGKGESLLEAESGYGFVDEDGNVIYDFVLDAEIKEGLQGPAQDATTVYSFCASSFTKEGLAVVKQKGKYGVIAADGRLICDFTNDACRIMGNFIVCTKEDKDILLDKDGNTIFGAGEYRSYKGVNNTSDYVLLQNGEKWGVYHITDGFTVDCGFDDMEASDDGKFLKVKKDGKHGVLSLKGEVVVPLVFDKVTDYDAQTAIVEKDGLQYLYFIQKNETSAFSFDAIEVLPSAGEAKHWSAKDGNQWGIIDTNGNWLLEPKFEALSGKGERIRAICYDAASGYYDEYYDLDLNLMFYYLGGKTYDAKGREIYPFEIAIWSAEAVDGPKTIYKYGRHFQEGGYVAVNRIPTPQTNGSKNYICLMLENPLMNANGAVYPIEENDYFFKPILEDGRVLVPLRALSEAMGASVQWEGDTQTITIKKDERIITLQINCDEMNKNGERIQLDAPARLKGDRTFVPFRAISEGLGTEVEWDETRQTITVLY